MFSKGPNIQRLELDSNMNPEIQKKLINKEFTAFMIKAVISLVLISTGLIYTYLGVLAESKLEFIFKGFTLKLNTAYAGIVIITFGVILLLFSRYNIKSIQNKGRKKK